MIVQSLNPILISDFSMTKQKIERELLLHGVQQSSIRQWILLNLTIHENQLKWSFNLEALISAFEEHLTLVPEHLTSEG